MDASTFRWILVIVGVSILIGIFLLGNPERFRRPRASRKRNRLKRDRRARRVRQEPTLDGDAGESAAEEEPRGDPGQAELAIEPRLDAPEQPPPPGPPPEKIVALFLQARDNHRISGVDLLDAALKSGMVFGEQDIFHRVQEGDDRPIFSMADLAKPGSFDKTGWNTLEVKGVTMFMTLPGPLGALDGWDALLGTARHVAELLHADLLDENQSTFTRQREGQIREELREYERQKQPEG